MRALVAIDLNDADTPDVLGQAGAHAAQLGAVLDVLFVDGLPYIEGMVQDPGVANALRAEARRLKLEHEQKLAAMVATLDDAVRGKGIPVYDADPTEVICERSRDYDLLMIGTHGRTGLQHLMLGSVAQSVVRRAPVPTLVLRAGAREG